MKILFIKINKIHNKINQLNGAKSQLECGLKLANINPIFLISQGMQPEDKFLDVGAGVLAKVFILLNIRMMDIIMEWIKLKGH